MRLFCRDDPCLLLLWSDACSRSWCLVLAPHWSTPRPHHPSRSLIGRSWAPGTPLAEQAEVTRASWSYTFAPLIRDLKEAAGTRSRNLIISNQDLQVNLCRTVHHGPLKITDVASNFKIPVQHLFRQIKSLTAERKDDLIHFLSIISICFQQHGPLPP